MPKGAGQVTIDPTMLEIYWPGLNLPFLHKAFEHGLAIQLEKCLGETGYLDLFQFNFTVYVRKYNKMCFASGCLHVVHILRQLHLCHLPCMDIDCLVLYNVCQLSHI